jgi:hypothetical protein
VSARELQEIRRDLQDLTAAVDAVAFQLEQLVLLERTLAVAHLGDDPLSDYYELPTDDAQGEEDPDLPRWDDGYPPPERDNPSAAAGIVVLAANAGVLVFIVYALWVIGQA